MNKSYFSKIKSGVMMPANGEIIIEIADAMKLSFTDKSELCRLYRKERLGDKYINIEDSLKEVSFLSDFQSELIKEETVADTHNHGRTSGKTEVYKTLEAYLEQAEEPVDMMFCADNKEICSIAARVLSKKKEDFRCRWLLYLSNSDEEISEYNIKTFSLIIPVMLSGKVSIHYEYADIEALYRYSEFPTVLISGKTMMLINGKYTEAIVLNREDITEYYIRIFNEKYGSSSNLCVMFGSIGEFIQHTEDIFNEEETSEAVNFYVIKKNPCVMFEGNTSIVKEHICDSTVSEEFVQNYMSFLLTHTINSVNKQYIMFSEQGAKEFLETKEYYEYHKTVDYPVSKELRHIFYDKFLTTIQKTDAIQVNLINNDFFSGCEYRHCANIWSDGKLLLFLNFEERYRIMVFKEKSIVKSIIGYINTLRKNKIISSKKSAVEIMKELRS